MPYASYYLTGFLHERPLARLRADLADLGIEPVEGLAEPEDPAATLCDQIPPAHACHRFNHSAVARKRAIGERDDQGVRVCVCGAGAHFPGNVEFLARAGAIAEEDVSGGHGAAGTGEGPARTCCRLGVKTSAPHALKKFRRWKRARGQGRDRTGLSFPPCEGLSGPNTSFPVLETDRA